MGRKIGDGNTDDDHHGQLEVEVEHHDDDQSQADDGIDNLQKGLLEGVGDCLHITGKATQHVTKLVFIKIRDRNFIDFFTQIIAQVPNGILNCARDEIVGTVGTNFVKEGPDGINDQDPENVGIVDRSTRNLIGHIQQILRQLSDDQA